MIDPAGVEPQVCGAEEDSRLAAWLTRLLDPPLPSWEEAAERFWAAVQRMDGAPDALLVVELGGRERRRFGSEQGAAYEIHGESEALLRVLTGRMPLLQAAFDRSVFIRGSFPQLSVLAGAGFSLRYGEDDV